MVGYRLYLVPHRKHAQNNDHIKDVPWNSLPLIARFATAGKKGGVALGLKHLITLLLRTTSSLAQSCDYIPRMQDEFTVMFSILE